MQDRVVFLLFLFSAVPSWSATISQKIYHDASIVYKQQLSEYLSKQPKNVADEALMSTTELIEAHGYPAESHSVTTEDGYILTLHRIPYGRDGPSENRPVAFLQHGLLCSSADWVVIGPEKALAYILADRGYDVWMGNARGNTYSKQHNSVDPVNDANEFWNFSWHEIGYYDLPAMIDYVIQITGVDSIYYTGHSQGTTSFYVMASLRPEYNAKIKVHVSLAPVAYMNHAKSPLVQLVSFFEGPVETLVGWIGINEFLPSTEFLANAADLLCSDNSATQILCTNSLFLLSGFDENEMNATLLPVIAGHTPAGSSVRQILHYAQEAKSGHFRQYDHGSNENVMVYGTSDPPIYPLIEITAPTYLIYSTNDWLASDTDVSKLFSELGNPQGSLLVEDSNFNHLDYLYAIDVADLIYSKIINIFGNY